METYIAIIGIISISLIPIIIWWVVDSVDGFTPTDIEEENDGIYKYDRIHGGRRKMNMKEQVDYLRLKVKEYEEKYKQMIEEHEKYARALCFLSKFKFEYIKNKVLREETKQHSLTYGYYAISKTESVVNNLDNYHADAVVKTYDYIKQQLEKDNELAIYNGKVKSKVVNGWSAGPVCSAITSADYITPYASITKSKSKKKKKTSKKK